MASFIQLTEPAQADVATYGWRGGASIQNWLLAEPYHFEFIQAIRLLEQFAQTTSPSGHTPLAAGPDPEREVVRLRSNTGFDFPASELRGFLVADGQQSGAVPELMVNLYALAGAAAPLPDWVAELLLQQSRIRDHALRDFFDIFHHRLLSLFYRVHLHHRPWLEPVTPSAPEPRARNRMSQYLLSFAGLGLPELQNRLSIKDEELLPYAGLLWQRPRTMLALERILEHALGVPIHSRESLGTWHTIEPEDRTRLGSRLTGTRLSRSRLGHRRASASRNNSLGRTATLGTRVWDAQGRFDLYLGPLDFDRFFAFLPGGPSYRRLRALVRFYAGDLLEVCVHLRLAAPEIPSTRLGRSRLGWTSALKTRASTRNCTIGLQPL